ncbi:hypothetical protein TGARI_371250 [Toxoplasma gondii ARI]|uniref:Uncharacterized protein n=1 Tax=Toxoplasma gondii ARI TaxID=1074872 RepID=A0A139XPF7_TOXGO|nr:hypothetical protein TGARI_371250 [Toxoplasma gondii ARI]
MLPLSVAKYRKVLLLTGAVSRDVSSSLSGILQPDLRLSHPDFLPFALSFRYAGTRVCGSQSCISTSVLNPLPSSSSDGVCLLTPSAQNGEILLRACMHLSLLSSSRFCLSLFSRPLFCLPWLLRRLPWSLLSCVIQRPHSLFFLVFPIQSRTHIKTKVFSSASSGLYSPASASPVSHIARPMNQHIRV